MTAGLREALTRLREALAGLCEFPNLRATARARRLDVSRAGTDAFRGKTGMSGIRATAGGGVRSTTALPHANPPRGGPRISEYGGGADTCHSRTGKPPSVIAECVGHQPPRLATLISFYHIPDMQFGLQPVDGHRRRIEVGDIDVSIAFCEFRLVAGMRHRRTSTCS